NAVSQLARDGKLARKLDSRKRPIATEEILRDVSHQPKCDEFTSTLIYAFRLPFLDVGAPVLVGVGYLRPKQHDQPGEIHPHEKEREHREAAVNVRVGNGAGHVNHVEDVVQLPEAATNRSSH